MIPRTSDGRFLVGNIILTLKQTEILLAIINNPWQKNFWYAEQLGYNSHHTFRKTMQVVFGKFQISQKHELQRKAIKLLEAE